MAPSLKKAIVRYLNREWAAGYLPPGGFASEGVVTLLDPGGNTVTAPLSAIKWICFVRQFNSGEPLNPERLLRRTFASRPRIAGLWLTLQLADGDVLEGLGANDASLLDSAGLFLTPPDTRSNTQRIFVPRTSIAQLEVLSVVNVPARRKSSRAVLPELQDDLFSVQLPSDPA